MIACIGVCKCSMSEKKTRDNLSYLLSEKNDYQFPKVAMMCNGT